MRKLQTPNANIVFLGEEEGTQLELIESPNEPAEEKGKGVSLGFMVENAKEMAETLAKETDGNVVGPISPGPGSVFYFVADPDGYEIQLVQK